MSGEILQKLQGRLPTRLRGMLAGFSSDPGLDPRDSFGTKAAASGHLTPALKSHPAGKKQPRALEHSTACACHLQGWITGDLGGFSLGKTIWSVPLSLESPQRSLCLLLVLLGWTNPSLGEERPPGAIPLDIHTNLSLPGHQASPGFYSEHFFGM